MAKRKRAKGQTTIYKTLPRQQKSKQHEPHLKPEGIQMFQTGKRSLLHMRHPSCYSCHQPDGKS